MSQKASKPSIKKNIGLSVIAQIVSMCVGFVVTMILPKSIDEYQYAYFQTYLLYVGFVGIFHFGLLDGIMLRYSDKDYDELDKGVMKSQFVMLLIITGIISLIGVFLCCIFMEGVNRSIFVYVSIGIVLANVFSYVSYSFQITNRINEYAKLVIVYRVAYGLIVVITLVVGGKRFSLFCIADLLSYVICIVFTIPSNKQIVSGKIDNMRLAFLEAKKNITVGSRLLITNISFLLITGSAKIIIQRCWPTLVFGKVAFSFTVINLFNSLILAISAALFPAMKRMDAEQFQTKYSTIRAKLSPVLVGMLVLYYPGCWIINLWLPNYSDSLGYLGISLPMIIFASNVLLLTNNYFKTTRKEKQLLGVFVATDVFAVIVLVFCAVVLKNLELMLISQVVVWAFCSLVSEIIIARTSNIKIYQYSLPEMIMAAGFIITIKLKFGIVIYSLLSITYYIVTISQNESR